MADYRWLVGDEGRAWLARIDAEPAWQAGSLVARLARLRKHLSAERAHLAVQQADLRSRARAKFSAAEQMFFTPLGLEQSSDDVTAAYKAERFAAGAAVADLCCGIGGDLMALAARGSSTGVDRDAVAAVLCEANLAVLGDALDGRTAARVVVGDVESHAVSEYGAWHIDPDRRPAGRRTTRVELHEPSAESIDRLLAASRNAAVKLAPAAELHDAWRRASEQEWISRDGECRQLVAWFGALARHIGRRAATVLKSGGAARRTVVGEARGEPHVPCAASIGRYLFEPDAAVLAAHLTANLAADHSLAAVDESVAYLTGDDAIADAALAAFEVLDVLPYDTKRVRGWLAERGIGRLEVKKRGIDLDPERVRRELRPKGDRAATLIFTPLAGRVTVILASRLAPP